MVEDFYIAVDNESGCRLTGRNAKAARPADAGLGWRFWISALLV